jgi:hypothetical protein
MYSCLIGFIELGDWIYEFALFKSMITSMVFKKSIFVALALPVTIFWNFVTNPV